MNQSKITILKQNESAILVSICIILVIVIYVHIVQCTNI